MESLCNLTKRGSLTGCINGMRWSCEGRITTCPDCFELILLTLRFMSGRNLRYWEGRVFTDQQWEDYIEQTIILTHALKEYLDAGKSLLSE